MADVATKAYRINQDPSIYGVFAEIGAGQEVARAFFKAGGASKTVAKSMSAYDMMISNDIYGETSNRRFVSKERLTAMLDHEYKLLISRLEKKRPIPSRYFVFANTVTTKSRRQINLSGGESHGWVGLRFQAEIGQEPSTIQIHVRMLDRGVPTQHEAMGLFGVNLIHSCFFDRESIQSFLSGWGDQIGMERLEIDSIELSGPAFTDMPTLAINLQLILFGAAKGFIAKPNKQCLPAGEIVFGKPVFSVRGSFLPYTLAHENMIKSGLQQFAKDRNLQVADVQCCLELTIDRIEKSTGNRELPALAQALERRLQILHALGFDVLVTADWGYDDLVAFYRRYTQAPIALGIGIRNLARLFCRKDEQGTVLGYFGRVFQKHVTMYVFPWRDKKHLNQISYDHPDIPQKLHHLFHYLADDGYILNIESYNSDYLDILPSQLMAEIKSAQPGWENKVPEAIVPIIKQGIY